MISSRRLIWTAALLVFAACRVLPPAAGLDRAGQTVLGIAAAMALLWALDAAPLGVTSLLALVLLGTVPGLRPTQVFGGFAFPVVFFLIGGVAIAIAVERTGLAARVARQLLAGARGRPGRLYAQLLVSLPAMAVFLPSAITRNAILIPAYRESLDAMGLRPTDGRARAVMLTLGVLNPLASSALLTGGIASMTAASLLGRLLVAALVRADGGAVLRVAHARRDRAVADLTRGGPRAPSRRRARGPHAAHRPRASHAGGSPAHDHALAHRCLARLEPVDSCVAGGAPARRAGHRRLRVERPRGAPVVGAHPDGGSIAVAGQRADLDHRSAVARKSPHRHGDGASSESPRPRGRADRHRHGGAPRHHQPGGVPGAVAPDRHHDDGGGRTESTGDRPHRHRGRGRRHPLSRPDGDESHRVPDGLLHDSRRSPLRLRDAGAHAGGDPRRRHPLLEADRPSARRDSLTATSAASLIPSSPAARSGSTAATGSNRRRWRWRRCRRAHR